MIRAYAIAQRAKFSSADLTVELYGCNIECRHCCSAYGRRRPAKYLGVDQIFERIKTVASRGSARLVRFTGGEFSMNGHDAVRLYPRVASLGLPVVIETNMTLAPFWQALAEAVDRTLVPPPAFVVSVKSRSHVTRGRYDPGEVVANIRRLYTLFPRSHIAHGFIGFGDGFRQALFDWFPELEARQDEIYLEREGRFCFQALRVAAGDRDLYYFDQKVKKYRVGSRSSRRRQRSEPNRGDAARTTTA